MTRRHKQIEWTPDKIAKFWDYTSAFPELYFTFKFGDVIVGKLKKYLKGKNVLDYGCGTGFLIPHLLDAGCSVTGLDFSEKSVEGVNERFAGRPGFNGAFRLEKLLEENKKFEVIILVEVIEHLDDAAFESVIKNIKQLVAKDGVVIFTTPNDERLNDSEVFCPNCEQTFHRWQHIRSWNEVNLPEFLNKSGLDVFRTFLTDFSVSFSKTKIGGLKGLIKKMMRMKAPHLVCIAKLPD